PAPGPPGGLPLPPQLQRVLHPRRPEVRPGQRRLPRRLPHLPLQPLQPRRLRPAVTPLAVPLLVPILPVLGYIGLRTYGTRTGTTWRGVAHAFRGVEYVADDQGGRPRRDRERSPERGRLGAGPPHGDAADQPGVCGVGLVAVSRLL